GGRRRASPRRGSRRQPLRSRPPDCRQRRSRGGSRWCQSLARPSARAPAASGAPGGIRLKVMLIADVDDVGRAGEVKEVADGFARNYLLRRKLAVAAHRGIEAEGKRLREATVRREAKDRDEAQALADEIGNKTVVVRLKVGEGDKV